VSSSAPPDDQKQGQNGEELDLRLFIAICGRLGAEHDGEIAVAARKLVEMLGRARLTFADVVAPPGAVEVLAAEVSRLDQENARLRALPVPAPASQWSDAAPASSGHQGAARWALDLERQGRVSLSPFEREFMGTMTSWHGRLTIKQLPIFGRILTRVCQETGLRPPP
jgi:hypothetical protein